MVSSLYLDLASDLRYLDDHEFDRFKRCESYHNVHDSAVDIILCRRFLIAFHKIGFVRRRALKGSQAEQVLHEGIHASSDLLPERSIVRLEHDPVGILTDTFFDE